MNFVFEKLKKVYQERLTYYAGVPRDGQYEKIEDILGDMEGYRRNIDILIRNQDRDLAEKETLIFNEYIDKFSQFIGEEDQEYLSEPSGINPDLEDTIQMDSMASDSISVVADEDTTTVEN